MTSAELVHLNSTICCVLFIWEGVAKFVFQLCSASKCVDIIAQLLSNKECYAASYIVPLQVYCVKQASYVSAQVSLFTCCIYIHTYMCIQ